jgi:hypothetical protein
VTPPTASRIQGGGGREGVGGIAVTEIEKKVVAGPLSCRWWRRHPMLSYCSGLLGVDIGEEF